MKMNKQNMSVPTRLLNVPLLVDEESVNIILRVLEGGLVDLNSRIFFLQDQREIRQPEQGPIAIIPVIGGLAYRGYGWYWRTSYVQIRKNFMDAMADPAIEAVVFDIDSPGGEVAGVFDLVDDIYRARGEKPIYAIANENAYSGAYAIASAADKIYLSRTASVGSVGVIAVHVDQSEWDKKLGVKYTPIFAGARKNDFSSHQPLSKTAKDIAQDRVDKAYDLFVETVARNRNMAVDAIRDTEAAIFRGNDAVEAGLADAIMPWDQALEEITLKTKQKGGLFMKLNIADLKTGLKAFLEDQNQSPETIEMLAQLGYVSTSEVKSQEDIEKQLTEVREKGFEEATQRAVEIISLCHLAGMTDIAARMIQSKDPVEDIRKKIQNEKASKAENEGTISSTVGPLGTGEVNPLIADAESRATKAVKT